MDFARALLPFKCCLCVMKVHGFLLVACCHASDLQLGQISASPIKSIQIRLRVWLCGFVFLSATRHASLRLLSLFNLVSSVCALTVNCCPCRSSDCQCDYCSDGWRVARCSVLLCRTRSKSPSCLPKLAHVQAFTVLVLLITWLCTYCLFFSCRPTEPEALELLFIVLE